MVLAATGLIAAAGLAGLARRDIPERAFLWLTLLSGLVALSAGFGGAWGNPFSGQVRWMLDGPLGAFRTVYKFAPVVALVLVVGLAHTITVLGEALQRRRPRGRVVVAVLAGALVIAGAWPLLRGDLLNQRGFDEVPAWWSEATAYVEDTPGRTLLVPGPGPRRLLLGVHGRGAPRLEPQRAVGGAEPDVPGVGGRGRVHGHGPGGDQPRR